MFKIGRSRLRLAFERTACSCAAVSSVSSYIDGQATLGLRSFIEGPANQTPWPSSPPAGQKKRILGRHAMAFSCQIVDVARGSGYLGEMGDATSSSCLGSGVFGHRKC